MDEPQLLCSQKALTSLEWSSPRLGCFVLRSLTDELHYQLLPAEKGRQQGRSYGQCYFPERVLALSLYLWKLTEHHLQALGTAPSPSSFFPSLQEFLLSLHPA